MWSVFDRLSLHGGRGQIHIGRHGRPQRYGQPRGSPRQRPLKGQPPQFSKQAFRTR